MEKLSIANPERSDGDHTQLTRDLKRKLRKHNLEGFLETSLERAWKRNENPQLNPVNTVDEYYDFVDRMGKLIPRDVLSDPPKDLQKRLLQNCAYFYYLIDQPPIKGEDDGYSGTLQNNEHFEDWLTEYVDTWGEFLSSEESWNRTIYRQFYYDSSFGLQNDWYESASNWDTFNDFFSRYLRSPAARPIAQQGDPSVVTSPADSCPQGTWDIDENSKIDTKSGSGGNGSTAADLTGDSADGVGVKLDSYYDVNKLLGPESDYHGSFKNGTFTHTFLNINDYHRYHFPVSGTVKEKHRIAGNVKLNVKWKEEVGRYELRDTTGWQFSQTRGSVVLETDDHGLVAVLPIGMGQVSSVNFGNHVEKGRYFEKGDMLGYFLFGGSDIIMLFQEGYDFEQTVPKGKHVLMGNQYGTLDD